jgi:hypothetical protein
MFVVLQTKKLAKIKNAIDYAVAIVTKNVKLLVVT